MPRASLPKPIDTDLLLVFPPFERLIVSMENLGIEYIAAAARERGFDARLINAGLHGLTTEEVIRIVERSRCRVLGISTIHWTMDAALQIAKAAKDAQPDCHVILGGVEAALRAADLVCRYPFIDSVALGEGEPVVSELLSRLARRDDWRRICGLVYRDGDSARSTGRPELIDPLDALPFPARDDIAAVIDSGGPVSIGTSRGCFGHCAFCSVRAFYAQAAGRPWRGRSAESVVEEMRHLHDLYGVRLFSFVDETVMGPGVEGGERLRRIAGRIKRWGAQIQFFMTIRADQVDGALLRELKEVGLRKVEIGIESMAPTQLRRYGKTATVADNGRALCVLDELGIQCEVFMIPYDPELTHGELAENIAFYRQRFRQTRPYDVAGLTVSDYLYPYHGTKTREFYEDRGWVERECYIPFHADEESLAKAQRLVSGFVGLAASAFPLSYLGLGNLWINSRKLPNDVYAEIGRLCSAFGELVVDLTEWACHVFATVRCASGDGREAISSQLRQYLQRAAGLRARLARIVAAHGKIDDSRYSSKRFPNRFAEQLYRLGRQRREAVVCDTVDRPWDEDRIVAGAMRNFFPGGTE